MGPPPVLLAALLNRTALGGLYSQSQRTPNVSPYVYSIPHVFSGGNNYLAGNYYRVCVWQTKQNNKPFCKARKSTSPLNWPFGTKWP